jgi:hypothetical protein
LCGARLKHDLINFGALPRAAIGADHAVFPLRIMMCATCRLVQTAHKPPPGPWGNALNDSGAHMTSLAQKWRLGFGSRVMHVGSGDASLLRHFQARGADVLGIEASPEAAAKVLSKDLPYEVGELTAIQAMDLAARQGRADLVIVGQAILKAPDLFDFAAGLAALVRPDGVVSITVPDLLSILLQIQFDAFCHDIQNYLSLAVLERLLCSVGLRVFDAERLPEEGGLLRIHACPTTGRFNPRPGLKAVRLAETATDTGRDDVYAMFNRRVGFAKDQIGDFLAIRQAAGRRVAGCGTSYREIMLLNICGISTATLSSVVSDDASAPGAMLPGCLVPVISPQELIAAPPHDLLMLPWTTPRRYAGLVETVQQHGTHVWTLIPRLGRA